MISNLVKLCIENGGSISPSLIESNLTDGTGLCNSSIFIDDSGDILLNLRHVHYILYHSEFNQKYWSTWGCLAYLNPEDFIKLKTDNYVCKLNPNTLYIEEYKQVDFTKNNIPPIWNFHGLEDARIFKWDDKLYLCGVRRDTKSDGEGRMELSEIEYIDGVPTEISRNRINPPTQSYLEKNWMPILDMPYHFVKWTTPLEIVKVNIEDKTKEKVEKGKIDVVSSSVVISNNFNFKKPRDLRGSSQVIPFGEHRIAILHECDFWKNENGFKDANYYHRFILWDKEWNVVKITKPFKFMDARIEFNCGLAQKGDDFLITYGYQDNAAYVLRMPTKVLNQLEYEQL
jgi:hypothetical protein